MMFEIGKYSNVIEEAAKKLNNSKIVDRIWQRDFNVWAKDSTEISNRLGWLDCLNET